MKNPKRILIRFDKNSTEFVDGDDYNRMFIHTRLNFMVQKAYAKGYVYLNEIYDLFGIAWNCDMNNDVITKDALIDYHLYIVCVKSRRCGFKYYIDIRRTDS